MSLNDNRMNDPAELYEDAEISLEPNDWESEAEMDLRVSGPTFAEGQARLVKAMNRLTELAKPHLEGK